MGQTLTPCRWSDFRFENPWPAGGLINFRKSIGAAIVSTLVAVLLVWAPAGHADPIAYLLNVTVRPGYNFANADQALAYGHGICGKITAGESYPRLVADIKSDFNTTDEYQASYLISQAAQELCPQFIWQLRISAAN